MASEVSDSYVLSSSLAKVGTAVQSPRICMYETAPRDD